MRADQGSFFLAGSPAAGSYFPQYVAQNGTRLDSLIGIGPHLLSREDLAKDRLKPFAEPLAAWFESAHADAVLIRPDRYVFGTGSPAGLQAAWQAAQA